MEQRDREDGEAVELIPSLLGLTNYQEFAALLEQHPALLSDGTLRAVGAMTQAPAYGPLFTGVRQLLSDARSAPEDAWSAFAQHRRDVDARADELRQQQEMIDTLDEAGEPLAAIEEIDRAIPLAIEIGLGASVCELIHQRGRLLVRLNTTQRADEIDEGLQAFEAALEIALPGEQAARILMHRGLAYGERPRGDPSENIRRAINSLRDSLEQLKESDDDELKAMVRTNLAVALIHSGGPGRLEAAEEAVSMCRAALEFRRPERDATNWAYTQINLGYALRTVADLGGTGKDEARDAFTAVITQHDQVADKALVGGAHQALGRLELATAKRTPEEMIEDHEREGHDEPFDPTPALQSAREHLTAALELTPKTPDTSRYVAVLVDLSKALEQLGDNDGALAFAEEGLGLVTPQSSPVSCRELASRVGAIRAEREDWPGASAAFATAIAAAEITFNARLDSRGRASEVQSTGNLHRWAAYAYARAGDLEAAAATLDSGRARELQRRIGVVGDENAALRNVPAELRTRYEAAAKDFAATPIDAADSDASRLLGEAVADIRALPGLAEFQAGVRWTDVVAAVESDWPLVYVNPTPQGTLLLLLTKQDDVVAPQAGFVQVTSTEVFMRLFVGGGEIDQDQETGSFMIAASGQGNDTNVARGLDDLLPWLSDEIAAPLVELLDSTSTTTATLVLCGPVDMAPLQAAQLPGGGGGVIADRFTLRYAPSAVVAAASVRRARSASQKPVRLVALADPERNLPAAEPEMRGIAELFAGEAAQLAAGPAATLRFLADHASEASHLHLACHARSGLFDAEDAVINLASGPLPATSLPAVTRLTTRLTVVSACQTAQSTLGGLLQAEFSVAAALLAAGSACVIASLWPVDDLATAMLMTRLYEELGDGTPTPPEALRAAQLWLRDSTEAEEKRFLDRHPKLAAEYARRIAENSLVGRRGNGARPAPERRPYSHPDYWAAFVAFGA